MSEQSTLRHYTTDVYEYVCLHRNAHLWVPSLLLHTKDKTLISEKHWNSSTTSAEQLNQRQQFHWRRREEKRETKIEKERRWWWWLGAEQEINQGAVRKRHSIACVRAVIIQQASIMELQQRTKCISLWPGLLTLSWTQSKRDPHISVQQAKRAVFLSSALCAVKWYSCVCECACVCIPYYSFLTSYLSSTYSVFTPTPTCLPAACNKNMEISKDQPASLSLSSPSSLQFSNAHARSHREKPCVLRVGTRWDDFFSSPPSCIRPTHPNSAISSVC